nr:GNAT family N-acetyltransferase [Aquibacillus saliphilus]
MNVKIAENDRQQQDAFQVRNTVFVEEQKVPPELEIDELENESIHFVGYQDNKPIAAGRLRFVDEYGKLERVCVLEEFRGHQFGKQIITEMEQVIKKKDYPKSKLNAQTHAEGFYESIGYHTISDQFIDAGISHVTMIKKI